MIIEIDEKRCSGHARCAVIAGGVFEVDDEGYNRMGKFEVPPEMEKLARRGARACPEGAITIIEEEG